MRAWLVDAQGEPADVLRLGEVDVPEPGPGQVRIRVAATGIGLPDVFMCRGTYAFSPPKPFTPGQEVAGTVTAVGADVDVPLGSRVMAVTAFPTGHGGYAEEALAFAGSTFPVPDGLADEDAAGFWIPHLTGWIGLVDRGQLAPGEWLVVLGAAGSSGIAAVQLGKALGARVVAVVGDDAKGELCRSVGADVVVDHRAGPLADALKEATGGHGADAIYDPVGGAAAEAAARALARGGRLLAVGFASGSWPSIDVYTLVRANAAVVGVFAGGYDRAVLEEMHGRMAALVADGAIRSVVTERWAFEELPAALTRLAGRGTVGKSVLLSATA